MGAIIGLSGYSGSGKDYVADAIIRDFPEYKFRKIYFADDLKKSAAKLLGMPEWDMYSQQGKQKKIGWLDNMTVREFLQKYGCAIRNSVHTDFWARKLISRIGVDENVIVPDMRFPNEFDVISDVGFCARVNRSALLSEWNKLSGLHIYVGAAGKSMTKEEYIGRSRLALSGPDKLYDAMIHESEIALNGHKFDHTYSLNTGEKPVHRKKLSKYIFENGYVYIENSYGKKKE